MAQSQTSTTKQKSKLASSASRAGLKKSAAKANPKTAGKPKVKVVATKVVATTVVGKGKDGELAKLPKNLLLQMHDLMVKSRVLEERLIKIYKAGDSYFWIGAPGEEAWGVPLGLLAYKGQGPEYDFLHLHYRCTPTLVAMGLEMIDSIRLMMNRSTDPSTGGRNFSNHYVFPKWNIAPVTSPIEVQYIIALGTAHIQKKIRSKGVTIVTGGDAGTAEADFASSLVWSSRRGRELPMLLTVQNNKWGISTHSDGQHGENEIADRARAFNIKARVIDGTNPVETYLCVQEDLAYIRKTGKPAFIEAHTTRLYGHSSASGANLVTNEKDPVKHFEERLLKAGHLKSGDAKEIWERYEAEGVAAQMQAKTEPVPQPESIWEHTFFGGENADWRKF